MLSHEAAHARRRDPLRRLIAPLPPTPCSTSHWSGGDPAGRAETAELRADQATVRCAGREAAASALLAAGEAGAPAGTAAYGGVTDARVAQLLGDDVPARCPSPALVIVSVAGLVTAVWLAMCLGQAALTWTGLS